MSQDRREKQVPRDVQIVRGALSKIRGWALGRNNRNAPVEPNDLELIARPEANLPSHEGFRFRAGIELSGGEEGIQASASLEMTRVTNKSVEAEDETMKRIQAALDLNPAERRVRLRGIDPSHPKYLVAVFAIEGDPNMSEDKMREMLSIDKKDHNVASPEDTQ